MRKANGTGSIYKLSGNRRKPWCVRVTKGWEMKEQKFIQKRKVIGCFKTYEEAEIALNEFLNHPKKYHNGKSYVYVVSNGRFLKIGKSNNPNQRIKSLQTASSEKLQLLKSFECENEEKAYILESKLQNIFSSKRTIPVNGSGRPCEWFDVTLEDIINAERRCSK